MTDTSNADNSPDASPSPSPKAADPTPIITAFRRNEGGDTLWERGRDQPTTVANWNPGARAPDKPPPPGPMPGQRIPQPGPAPRGAPIPPNLPQPPARFNAYLPAWSDPVRGRRSPNMWGNPEPFAPQPQPFEAPGILQGVGQFFSLMGSGVSMPMGLGMMAFSSAYTKAFNAGKTELAKQHLENLKVHAAELDQQQQEESDAYAEVVNTYGANGWKPVNGVSAEQALTDVAMRYGDTNLMGILHTKGVGGAYNLIMARDAHWQDHSAANKTIAKEAEDQKILSDWGVPGATAPTETPGSPTPSIGATPLGAPGPPPDPNAPAPNAQPASLSQPETQKDRVDTLAPYQRAGLEFLRGGVMTGVDKPAQPYVRKYADHVLGQMDDLVAKAQAGGMTRDEIEQGLRAINPAIAGEFADIRDLNTPLPGGMGAINAHPFWRDIESLARASVPGWRVNDYQQVGEMQRDYTTGTSSRRMQAANNMADAAVPLLKALKDIPEGEIPPVNWIDNIVAKKFTGDPRWVRLYNAVQMYVQESQSLASPTGRYFEGDVNRLMHEFDIAQGTQSIRGIIATDADAAQRRLQTLKDDYTNGTRKDIPPHYNAKSNAIIAALAQLDPQKGFANVAPGQLPDDLQGLGMGQTAPESAAPAAAPPAAPSAGWGTLQ